MRFSIIDRRFDSGVATLTASRGAPRLAWGWNPWDDIKSAGSAVKNGVVSAGHVVGQVASNPLVDGVIGATLGPGAAALAGGVGRLIAPGGNAGEALKGGAIGYGAGQVGSLVGNGVRGLVKRAGAAGGGVQGDGDDAAGGDPTANTGSSGIGGLIGSGARVLGGKAVDAVTGGVSNLVNKATSMSPLDLAMAGLAAQQGVASAKASARASDLSDQSLALAKDNWNNAAPLRAAGTTGLLNRTKPNLTSVYQNPANPFAARRRPLLPPGAAR